MLKDPLLSPHVTYILMARETNLVKIEEFCNINRASPCIIEKHLIDPETEI